MANINENFIAHVKINDATTVVALLKIEANVHYRDDWVL